MILSLVAAIWLPKLLTRHRHRYTFAASAAAIAALFSAGYATYYLSGAPRIIDATAYWLQARGLANGWLSWPVGTPEHSILGRFLLPTEQAQTLSNLLSNAPGDAALEAGRGAMVIFPPGYPVILALGFAAGAPMAVGPTIAAGLVLATMALARTAAREFGDKGTQHEFRIRLCVGIAAVFSICCATLRCHTADTMAHGLASLCFTVALWAALTAWQQKRPFRGALIAGLAAGWLVATRPVTAMALWSCLLLWAAVRLRKEGWSRRSANFLSGLLLGAVPGICLWGIYQYVATGSLLSTTQGAYYALSDGPPGCFSYGFGTHIGCLGEHGPFVRSYLGDGYGAGEALATTGRRLTAHLTDPLNFPPLFALVPLGFWLGRKTSTVRVAGLGIVLLIACYLPFYFDGNYPGGGARIYADVLPLEHVLAAIGVATLAQPRTIYRGRVGWLVPLVVVASLLGFAFHAGAFHHHLRSRHGGRPLFEQHQWRAVRPAGAMLFMDTDHGFNLAFEPGAAQPRVVRHRGDALDRLAWEARGRPAAFRYYATPPELGPVLITPLEFDPSPTARLPLRIEGESLWPPRWQRGAWAWPEWTEIPCASAGRWLVVRPAPSTAAADPYAIALQLPTELHSRQLRPRVYLPEAAQQVEFIEISLFSGTTMWYRWDLSELAVDQCIDLSPASIPPHSPPLLFTIRSSTALALDSLNLSESALHYGTDAKTRKKR